MNTLVHAEKRDITNLRTLVELDEPILALGDRQGEKSLWARLRDHESEFKRWVVAPIGDIEWRAIVGRQAYLRDVMEKDEARIVRRHCDSLFELVEYLPVDDSVRDLCLPRKNVYLPRYVVEEQPDLNPPPIVRDSLHLERKPGQHRVSLRDLGACSTAVSAFVDAYVANVAKPQFGRPPSRSGVLDAVANGPGSFAIELAASDVEMVAEAMSTLRAVMSDPNAADKTVLRLRSDAITRVKLARLMTAVSKRKISVYAAVNGQYVFLSPSSAERVRKTLGVVRETIFEEDRDREVVVQRWDVSGSGVFLDTESNEHLNVRQLRKRGKQKRAATSPYQEKVLVNGRYRVRLQATVKDRENATPRVTYLVREMSPVEDPSVDQ